MENLLSTFLRKTTLAFVLISIATTSFSQNVHKDFIDGQIWFRLKDDKIVSSPQSIDGEKMDLNNMKLSSMPYLRDVFTNHSITRLVQPFPKAYGSDDLMRTYRIEFADVNNVDDFLRELEQSGAVLYAEKVPLMKLDLTPNDPLHNSSNMWNLFQINAEQAWNVGTGSSSIVVAVTDNAIEIAHSDLSGVIWTNPGEIPGNGIDDDGNGYIDDVNGWDTGGNNGTPDNDPSPPSSSWDHGTHCSGTVGAETNNNNGLSSIGFGISIMAVKSTRNSAGSNSITNGYDGIYYAAVNNADIISCSWGGSSSSQTGLNVVNWATSQGSIVVAAAGNDGTDNDVAPHYPSNYSNAVAVSSTTTGDVKSSFSNYGANSIDISAPGSNIASTVPFGNYAFMSGTSMATPLVSGLLGLMKSLNPSMPNQDLLNCMYNTAVNIDGVNPSYAGELGAGRIDAFAAMNCVAATLNNPPIAEFSANITTITAGGSVTFTDQSTFGPTSWSWNFDNQGLGGVTPATANTQGPHIVTYANPGFYEVRLLVSNGNGNDTEIKTAYIEVTPAAACNELNLNDPTFAAPGYGNTNWNMTYYTAGGEYISGSQADSRDAVAEYFPSAMVGSNTQVIEGMYFIISKLSNVTNPTISMNVWNVNGSGTPTTIIDSKTFNLSDFNAFTIYYRAFDTPIQVPASSEFAVGFDFSNLNPAAGDTFIVFTNTLGEPSTSTGQWQANGGGAWTTYASQFGGNLSLYLFPQLTEDPASASLSATPLTICEGDQVYYDATGSTYQDTLLWSFPGQNPNSSNNVMDSIIYTTAGTYTSYLEVVGGGCGNYAADSITITVNPTPSPAITASADTICNGNSVNLSTSGGGTYLWTPGGSTSSSINPSPTSNTTYSVAVTSGGCTGETSKTIYVQDVPTANALHTVGLKCVGSSVNFDGSTSIDANTYSWSFPAGSPSISSSNSPFPVVSFGTDGFHPYSLTVTNICGSHTHNRNLTISPLPNVVANATATSICQGDPVTLSGSGAQSYSWDNGVNNGVPFTPGLGSVLYTVTGTGSNGCINTDTITVTVNVCTGIEDLATDFFNIYPNPANNIVNIVGLDNAKQVTLLDVTGKVVYLNNEINSDRLTIDLSNASKGLYFLQVQTDNKLDSYKIIKQ